MDEYLLVESVGPPVSSFVGDAAALAARGDLVTLLLIENGVAGAVSEADPRVREFLAHGGRLWVDGYSLGQRALLERDLVHDAEVVALDTVATQLLRRDVRAVWH